MSERRAVIIDSEMSFDMHKAAVDCATQALEKYEKWVVCQYTEVMCFVSWLFSLLAGCLVGCLVGWLVVWLYVCLFGWLGVWLVVCLVGWFFDGWLVGCLAGCSLVVWLVVCLFGCLFVCFWLIGCFLFGGLIVNFRMLILFVFQDAAVYIKDVFDKKYKPKWHCILAPNFGLSVQPDKNCFICFDLGEVKILLFKSG
jgi:hypothetical protein